MASRKRGSPCVSALGKYPSTCTTATGGSTLDCGQQVRPAAAATRSETEQVAAKVNAQLSSGAPTLLAFTPIGLPDLHQQFLDYHEPVLNSSVAIVNRYRPATHHLENFVNQLHSGNLSVHVQLGRQTTPSTVL